MSRNGVDATVEQLHEDRALAEAVVADGPSALASFDLTDEERVAIANALLADVEAAQGEVSGFGSWNLGNVQLNNLGGVGRSLGGGGVQGHEQWDTATWID